MQPRRTAAWKCPLCTFQNHAIAFKCVVCRSLRGTCSRMSASTLQLRQQNEELAVYNNRRFHSNRVPQQSIPTEVNEYSDDSVTLPSASSDISIRSYPNYPKLRRRLASTVPDGSSIVSTAIIRSQSPVDRDEPARINESYRATRQPFLHQNEITRPNRSVSPETFSSKLLKSLAENLNYKLGLTWSEGVEDYHDALGNLQTLYRVPPKPKRTFTTIPFKELTKIPETISATKIPANHSINDDQKPNVSDASSVDTATQTASDEGTRQGKQRKLRPPRFSNARSHRGSRFLAARRGVCRFIPKRKHSWRPEHSPSKLQQTSTKIITVPIISPVDHTSNGIIDFRRFDPDEMFKPKPNPTRIPAVVENSSPFPASIIPSTLRPSGYHEPAALVTKKRSRSSTKPDTASSNKQQKRKRTKTTAGTKTSRTTRIVYERETVEFSEQITHHDV